MLDVEKILRFSTTKEHRVTHKDVILYALGLGIGERLEELDYVYESRLQALPSYGGVLGYPGFWIKDHPELGIDWKRVLNGEQSIALHGPLPTTGSIVGHTRVRNLVDKGPGKDVVLYVERDVFSAAGNQKLCTVANTILLRGQGSTRKPDQGAALAPLPPMRPDRPPDIRADFHLPSNLNLIYRLSGDLNPLHIDPHVASLAGFDRPILHGAATWGVGCYVMLRELCGHDALRVKGFGARFTAPVFPGDSLNFEIWTTAAGQACFRCTVPARGVVALDQGVFHFHQD